MIIERHVDFAMPLHHSPIYESLLHDLLELKSNHVTITSKNTNKKEAIYLDSEKDLFWNEMALEPLPKVHEHHTKCLQWYQEKQDEIQNKGTTGASSPQNEMNDYDEKSQNESQHGLLKAAIKSMPELLQKKEEIDRHIKLMDAVSEVIAKRSISEYFHLEKALMHSKSLDSEQSKQLNELLSISSKGNIEDKLRLFLIYYLCHHDVKRQTLNELISNLLTNMENNDDLNKYLLSNYNGDKNKLKALKYIIEHKKFLNLAESLGGDDEERKNDSTSSASNVTSWFASGGQSLFRKFQSFTTSGKCTVTRIVKLLMNTDADSALANVATSSVNILSQSQTNPHLKNIQKNYVTFDPLNKGNDKDSFQEYQRGIVFIVGGGAFSEYANLNEFANNKNKNIIYGCSDIVTPNDFLTQLSNLGE